MKRFLLPAVLMLGAACAKKEADDAGDKVQPVVGASVATVQAQRFVETVNAIGMVASRAGHVASLASPAPSHVTGVLVAVGSHVHAGDLLVQLDQTALEGAAKSAEAALNAAQSAAERAQRLADAGVSPRKEAEQAAAELSQARTNSANANRALALASMRSPITGVVTRMNAVLSAAVDVGQPLVDVTDPNFLDAFLTLSVADARRVTVGQTVAFSAGADAPGPAIATGRVVDVSGTVDSTSLGVVTRVELTSGMTAVRIGETLFGRVVVAEHASAVVVPLESLVPDGEAFKVFVVDDQGLAHSRPVTVGGRTDKDAWIKTGLKAGEHVVTHGAYGVSDSVKVVAGKDTAAKSAP